MRAIRKRLEKDFGQEFQPETIGEIPRRVTWDLSSADDSVMYIGTMEQGVITLTNATTVTAKREENSGLTVDIINKALKLLGQNNVPMEGMGATEMRNRFEEVWNDVAELVSPREREMAAMASMAAQIGYGIDKQVLDAFTFDFRPGGVNFMREEKRDIGVVLEQRMDYENNCMVVEARAMATNGNEYRVQFRVDAAMGDEKTIEALLMTSIEAAFRDEEIRSGLTFL